MITLRDNEKILLTLHHHWIIILARGGVILALGLIPFFSLFFTAALTPLIPEASVVPFLAFVSALFWLTLLLLFFVIWIDYWLDAIIITNFRLIRIDQRGLFWRDVSEFMLSRVENVNIETPGFLGTFFQFGNISVETAGEMDFKGRTMQNLAEAKNIILEYAEKNRGHE